MSRTIRRTQWGKKKHFFQHYWEAFSDREIEEKGYIKLWQYHSDNYYTKGAKNAKQFLKNRQDRKLRQQFRHALHVCNNIEDFLLKQTKYKSIKWELH